MTSVEFDDIRDVETMLRACVVFKFEGGVDSEVYAGSPFLASATKRLLDAVINGNRRLGNDNDADRWSDLYDLARHPDRVAFVRKYATRHPRWASMNKSERGDWLAVVAAPYRITDKVIEQLSR